MSWGSGRRRDGTEPARRGLALWQSRCAAVQFDYGRPRPRHAVLAAPAHERSSVEARHVHQIASHPQRTSAARPIKDSAMTMRTELIVVTALLVAVTACTRPSRNSPAETQPGAS